MSDIVFSIVVPFYNEARKLPGLIKSLIAQDFNRPFEIVLVDNLSTDDSYETCTRELSGFVNHRLLTCSEYRSSYAARNVGWREATGEHVVFIDADCVASPRLLSEYYDALSKASKNVKIFAGAVLPHLRTQATAVEEYSAERGLLNQESAVKGWAYRPFAQTANAMFPRSVLAHVGGFHPRLTSGGDGELCWRILDEPGTEVLYVAKAEAFHWHRETVADLFIQFEKYGVGRFQQSAVVPNFNKGLVGMTRTALIERLEALERTIVQETDGKVRKELLWSLFDLTAKVSNSHGYLAAKSAISSPDGLTAEVFARPVFSNVCAYCRTPNFDTTPTFARRGDQPKNSNFEDCATCSASLTQRLFYSCIGENWTGPYPLKTLDVRELPAACPIDRNTVYTLALNSSLNDRLVAITFAREFKCAILLVRFARTSSTISSDVAPVGMNPSFFFDAYSQNTFEYAYADYREPL